jgi:putative cell wall-binding protein/lysophospholipase L1-like esterase
MFKKIKNSLAISLSVAMLATMITIPSVASATTFTPLAGTDKYQTALKIAQKGWTTSENVIIARGDVLADALAAAPLAYAKEAPILLTKTDKIPAGVLEELKEMKVKKVYIVGGTGAVTKAVADKFDVDFDVERIEGKTRVETSYNIAQEAFGVAPKDVVIVNGYAYIDALSVSSIAAKKGIPILLVNNNKLSTDVASYITGKTVYAVGGTGVLSNEVIGSATRLYGDNRYDTNAAVLKEFKQDYSNIYLAKGTDENMVDALTGSALAAKGNNPIVLVDGKNAINDNQDTVVKANITASSAIFTLGGTVSDVAVNAIDALRLQAYVALGDSISTGYGLSDKTNDLFVNKLSIKTGKEQLNLAVNGLTTTRLLATLGTLDANKHAVIANTELITLSIGGDNLLHPLVAALTAKLGKHPSTASSEELGVAIFSLLLDKSAMDTMKSQISSGVLSFVSDFPKVIAALKALNPNATIIVQTIYNPIDEIPALGSLSVMTEEAIASMNTIIMSGSSLVTYKVADVYTAFKVDSSILTNAKKLDIHPNPTGQNVIYMANYMALNGELPYSITGTATNGSVILSTNPVSLIVHVDVTADSGYVVPRSVSISTGGQVQEIPLVDGKADIPVSYIKGDLIVTAAIADE